MNKNSLLKIVNPIMGLLFIAQILSGLFHRYIPHELFELVHEKGGVLLALLVVIHVALNWGWIRANFLKRKQRV